LRTNSFLLLSFFFIACQQQPHPMTPQEKETAQKEIAGIVDGIVRGCNQLDVQEALKPYSDSPNFVAVNTDGSVVDHEGFKTINAELFKAVSSFKFTTTKEDFRFLGDNLVLCTWIGRSEVVLKSGEHSRIPAFATTLLLSKVNNEWKIIYSHQSASPLMEEKPTQ
jgi:hypothetical protein